MKYLLLTALLLSLSSLTLAHTGLKSSAPEDNAMLNNSPEVLNLEFGDEVRLVKLVISNEKGKKLDIGFKPIKSPSKVFDWELVEVLAVGSYTVNWIAIGGDGHKMKGNFNFMVHAPNDMSHHEGMDHSK